jgi:hypothetical protein
MLSSSQSESSSPFDAKRPDTGETELFPDRSAPTGHRPRGTVPLVRNAAQKNLGVFADSRYVRSADSLAHAACVTHRAGGERSERSAGELGMSTEQRLRHAAGPASSWAPDVGVAPVSAARGRAQGGSSPRKRRAWASVGLTRPSTTVPWQSGATGRTGARNSATVLGCWLRD